MKISVNKAHFPVTVLGPGKRLGIWLQGCSIGCKGCVSQDTWPRDAGRDMSVAQLMRWCKEVTAGALDGVTISGGEPFDQPDALADLLDALDHWRTSAQLDFDVLCYSGYPWATLQRKHKRLLRRLDAVIPEPYVDALPITHVWRGSGNQTLQALSPRGEARYAAYLQAQTSDTQKRMQLQVDGDGRAWYIGIPARGDMQALQQQCEAQGVSFSEVSWRQ